MFDRSHLPPADFEFAILPDTHYMLDSVTDVEFASRRRQTARVDHAIDLLNALDPAFVVHLGDVVQEFPETDAFDVANETAREQLAALRPERHHVAGNHDVGDKPDPTMPTEAVTTEAVRAFHDRFGRSWSRWHHGGFDFLTLNSQLLNASLAAADEQRAWLESTLEDCDGPTVAFMHLPPFLHRPDEPARGHYDNVGRPARSWLLDLLRDHGVEALFAGHSHFEFRNRVDDLQIRVLASPSFTRPGFSELFSSGPPPEQGRDDRPKLGVYLVRLVDGDLRVHFVRTNGATGTDGEPPGDRLLTRRTPGMPDTPLGASLVHPISSTAEVPAVFPSAIRQRVHDDYPLLGCLELGLGSIRTPLSDLEDDLRRRKLAAFRRAGGTVVGTTRPRSDEDPAALAARVDEIELRSLGSIRPTGAFVDRIGALRRGTDRPISLSTTVPGRSVSGKQHDRFRTGYDPSELGELDDRLADLAERVDRVLCAVGSDPWATIGAAPAPGDLDHVGAVDWLLDTTRVGDRGPLGAIAAATAAVAAESDARLHVEPLRELDRTLDVAAGLLDRRRNPTPAFRLVRSLNAALFAGGSEWGRAGATSRDGFETYELAGPTAGIRLVLPDEARTVAVGGGSADVEMPDGSGSIGAISLRTGRVQSYEGADAGEGSSIEVSEPTALRWSTDASSSLSRR